MTDNENNSGRAALSRREILGLAAGATVGAAMHAAPAQSAERRANDIVLMDATVLSKAIHSRKVSCVEVMSAYLEHIERTNPKVNAIVALQERADLLIQARERDAQLARGESMGPLHGFPHAVKDLQAVKGIRMTLGSPILKDFVPAADLSKMIFRKPANGRAIPNFRPDGSRSNTSSSPVPFSTNSRADMGNSDQGTSGEKPCIPRRPSIVSC